MNAIRLPHGLYLSDTAHTKFDGHWHNISELEHAQLFKSRHQAEKALANLAMFLEGTPYYGGRVITIQLVPEE